MGFIEHLLEPLALDQKGVVDMIAAAVKGLGIPHALGDHQIGILNGIPGLLIDIFQVCCANVTAIVHHREGNAHKLVIPAGGIVMGRKAPDTECDFQVRISAGKCLSQQPVKADFPGVVRQVKQSLCAFQILTEAIISISVKGKLLRGFQHLVQGIEADILSQRGKSM